MERGSTVIRFFEICSFPAPTQLFPCSWFCPTLALILLCSCPAPASSPCIYPVPTLHRSCSYPAPALLLPCSLPAPNALLPCFCLSSAQLQVLPHSCSALALLLLQSPCIYPAPVLLLVCSCSCSAPSMFLLRPCS